MIVVLAVVSASYSSELLSAEPDPGLSAKATFAEAQKELREYVALLTTLQAEYQEPGADKAAIEAKFNETKKKAQSANDRLESSAFLAIAADPEDKSVLDVCGSLMAAAVQKDDPMTVLKHAQELDDAGVKNGDISMMAADSAMKLSLLDDAEAWLAKAEEAGVDKEKVAGLTQAIQQDAAKVKEEMAIREKEKEADDLPRVKITTSKGDIIVELFENEAPNTVANFIELVEKGFYDGTPFHRVIGGFMAQGGDPTGTGSGGPGYVIACECDSPDARKHFLGTLSMAHAGKDTGGSQFFLTFVPTAHLDGKHTAFGRVIEGFDVLPQLIRTEGAPRGSEQDKIVQASVLRKRNHPYESKKLPDPRG
jgi:cyclophilin family peptidyl-prolyl cis-trans isomerase